MFSRRRSKNDLLPVQALFDLHDLLNNSGRHWIKGMFEREIAGEMCYCLAGGVYALTKWDGPYHGLCHEMFELLANELEKWPGRVFPDDFEGACMAFNDDDNTYWPNVETVIHKAIGTSRRVKVHA